MLQFAVKQEKLKLIRCDTAHFVSDLCHAVHIGGVLFETSGTITDCFLELGKGSQVGSHSGV